MAPVVIIGTGLAGYTTAREFRKHDPDSPLLLLSRDDGAFYSKPMLSNALAQDKTPDQLATASAAQMAGRLQAQVRPHTEVIALDPARRELETRAGRQPYRQLVLALGADPIRLPLDGDGSDAVLSINDLTDYGRFRQALPDQGRIAILGAGLIGCEFANDLVSRGYSVSLIDPANTALGRLVPTEIGQALESAFSQVGIDWHLRTAVQRIDRQPGGYRLSLTDGSQLDADLVLSAVGLRPRTGLAATAGLAVDRGIRVDRYCRTSHDHIYAVGDCAEIAGLLLPFVMPLMQAARALARTLAGLPTAVNYPAMPVVVKTPAYPVVIAPPPPAAQGTWQIETGDNAIRARFVSPAGELLGFALGGAATADKQALIRDTPPWLAG